MAENRFKSSLDVLATIAILVTCGIVSWNVFVRPDNIREPAGISPYAAGEKFERIPGVLDAAQGGNTLVMYLRSDCKYCGESMNFYRRLFAERRGVRVVIVAPEPKDVLQQYVESNDLRPDAIISVTPRTLRFRGTPSLALLAPDGLIKAVWAGRLNADGEMEVLQALK